METKIKISEKIYIKYLVKYLTELFGKDVSNIILDYYLETYRYETTCYYCANLIDTIYNIQNIEKEIPFSIIKKKPMFSFGLSKNKEFDIYKVCTDKIYITQGGDFALKCNKIGYMDTNYIPPGCSCCLKQDLGVSGYYEYLEDERIKFNGVYPDRKGDIMLYCDIISMTLLKSEYDVLEAKYDWVLNM